MKLSVLIYEYSSAKAYKINILNALHFTKKVRQYARTRI